MTIATINTAQERARSVYDAGSDLMDYLETVGNLIAAAERVDIKAEPLDHPSRGAGVWIPQAEFQELTDAYQAAQ